MKAFKLKRLEKLATHLESGKLGHKKFNFAYYNFTEKRAIDGYDKKGCGTQGCAIGEMPFVFPKDWHFDDGLDPVLKNQEDKGPRSGSQDFFGIDHDEYSVLFMPETWLKYQKTIIIAGKSIKQITKNANKNAIAKRIRKFVSLKRIEQDG